jgi:hypothetical protein
MGRRSVPSTRRSSLADLDDKLLDAVGLTAFEPDVIGWLRPKLVPAPAVTVGPCVVVGRRTSG